jgi:hypothetical protein
MRRWFGWLLVKIKSLDLLLNIAWEGCVYYLTSSLNAAKLFKIVMNSSNISFLFCAILLMTNHKMFFLYLSFPLCHSINIKNLIFMYICSHLMDIILVSNAFDSQILMITFTQLMRMELSKNGI